MTVKAQLIKTLSVLLFSYLPKNAIEFMYSVRSEAQKRAVGLLRFKKCQGGGRYSSIKGSLLCYRQNQLLDRVLTRTSMMEAKACKDKQHRLSSYELI